MALEHIIEIIGASVTAIATIVLAVLTFIYVRLTKRILESQSDPYVIITVVSDKDRPSLLLLVVRNIGKGLAHDIRIVFSKSIPKKPMVFQKKKRKMLLL